MILKSVSLENLKDVAKSFFDSVNSVNIDHAYVVYLSGEIGAGKTTFTKCLAKELGVKETVHSPTFVVMRSYECEDSDTNKNFKNLIHIDAYRFEDKKEGDILSLEELYKDKSNLMLIEWPENMEAPKFDSKLNFSLSKNKDGKDVENLRDIKITYAK